MTFKPIFWAIFTCLRPFLREKIKIWQYMYIKTQYSSLFWKILMSSHMSGTLYTCGGSNIKKWRALIESTVKFSRSRFSKSKQKLTDCFHLFFPRDMRTSRLEAGMEIGFCPTSPLKIRYPSQVGSCHLCTITRNPTAWCTFSTTMNIPRATPGDRSKQLCLRLWYFICSRCINVTTIKLTKVYDRLMLPYFFTKGVVHK